MYADTRMSQKVVTAKRSSVTRSQAMASNQSDNANHTTNKNIQVKVEPGTSVSTLLKNIKTEPGLSSSTTRLTSFRIPRDLTLGGSIKTEKAKKIYTPNLNAQRNKKMEDGSSSSNQSKISKDRDRDRDRGRGRGGGREDGGRGRRKISTGSFIQSVGVFSEGITDAARPNRRYSGISDSRSDGNSGPSLEKPKLNLDRNVNKAAEEEKLKLLLRDDFIDNGLDTDLDNAPVMLPMIEDGTLYKDDSKVETVEAELKDSKPIVLANGEVRPPDDTANVKAPRLRACPRGKLVETTIPQILDSKVNSYILIQLPDCLPGLRVVEELNESRLRRSAESSVEGTDVGRNSNNEYCTLSALKEGLLGKLQIFKSGKARLVLGDNDLIVDVGSKLSFRQDLVATKIDREKQTGHLINLGAIGSTLICSPDWESLLANI